MKPRTAIAISGGIDSLVAASLLQERGHRLMGIHFFTGYQDLSMEQVQGAARQLNIPLEIVDVGDLFHRRVVDYFVTTYQKGLTPNPCLVCNPDVKFGAVMTIARQMGADWMATGHYARIRRYPDGTCRLFKGRDSRKDQSYFLAFLSQVQLSRALFPLGSMTKTAVRRLGAERGLSPIEGRESQDVCFIKGSCRKFLVERGGIEPRPGPISDVHGRIIGTHSGLHQFTVGQRKGINCPASEPYYVIDTVPGENRLVVGFRTEMGVSRCRLSSIRWIGRPPSGRIRLRARIRYRHQAVPATFEPDDRGGGTLLFDAPEPAVTPGQGAVFYRESEVLGGGWIERYR
ncbi:MULTISPECIES: tRNA 2-thiouridine(34) synthase MnmA [Desulfococcus]|uniref:tRNA-specific 2-thiouridylase MnmA n=1 Tax=Desulfococcus multivorans DSM 2059 TaxID=1121405 RepID=S7U748_DESML|nr:tRNA 2-thiouridine(34) synthase MnmA [Desulfococcus multivorans]AOY59156.1 MnmA: tRNA-specific 2-thiouridylase [Desulfococcus multivorans]AQV01388.1 tRNA(5-methylaminomethyl-2-thiouridine)-methyltransferase [Desulfococcus multivorans]EPR44965.1 tRNA-specific 2-thiouridylase mnmA [Desulfococcus multivorans DSM 2059]MDX9818926.1 tRNA 2-thiouridine(34) synthase MnmA [Desulfococcus multivorans]SJZ84490.1 tRNA-specific 2-thiouridylase [Desulfococcus multivorans DSM 2059]